MNAIYVAVLQKGKKEPWNEGPLEKNLGQMLATFTFNDRFIYSSTHVGNHIHTHKAQRIAFFCCVKLDYFLEKNMTSFCELYT